MPAGPSLYDILRGHIGGAPLSQYDDNTLEILSVMDNIRRILNTRAGSLKHLQDYGLPDPTNIYEALPASAHALKQQIEISVLAYEPRVRAIDIDIDIDTEPEPEPEPDVMIRYTMVCHLRKAGLVRFGTWFEPGGQLHLRG